jgi:hypothetical protein
VASLQLTTSEGYCTGHTLTCCIREAFLKGVYIQLTVKGCDCAELAFLDDVGSLGALAFGGVVRMLVDIL